jgi:cytochrome b
MSSGEKVAGTVANYVDERTGAAKWLKKNLTKVFPDHWSFMLGEIALYSFIILLLTGVFLTFWFDPSQRDVIYHGSYLPLNGIKMSAAYDSTLNISFDIRGGLLMRQVHHWAANLFMAAIVAHMLRVFFTGAFRKPREFNWIIGIGLLTLGIVEGFLGYSLPDASYRLLPRLLRLRWSISRNGIHPANLHRSRSSAPWNFPGSDHGSLNAGLVSEAHSIPRSWPYREECRWLSLYACLHG